VAELIRVAEKIRQLYNHISFPVHFFFPMLHRINHLQQEIAAQFIHCAVPVSQGRPQEPCHARRNLHEATAATIHYTTFPEFWSLRDIAVKLEYYQYQMDDADRAQ
jgi:hypothetical protein